jgi:radical SAM mobile pair protein B
MLKKINETHTKNVLTKSNLPIAGYSVNPYVGCPHACMYCYATFMKRFTKHSEPWGTFLDVKYWPQIKNPTRYNGETIIIGSVTDAYHFLEEKYERTRAFLQEMQGSEVNLIITTKSDLVLRDIDLIKNFPNPLVAFSINTLDEDFRSDMDAASTIDKRISAMSQLHKAGIRTACFISPIFPGITDVKSIISNVKNHCDYIWLENLNLRGDYKLTILNYIADKYTHLTSLYNEIYNRKMNTYWEKLDQEIAAYAEQNDFAYCINEEPFHKNPAGKPIIVNYFYHDKIKQSSRN